MNNGAMLKNKSSLSGFCFNRHSVVCQVFYLIFIKTNVILLIALIASLHHSQIIIIIINTKYMLNSLKTRVCLNIKVLQVVVNF